MSGAQAKAAVISGCIGVVAEVRSNRVDFGLVFGHPNRSTSIFSHLFSYKKAEK